MNNAFIFHQPPPFMNKNASILVLNQPFLLPSSLAECSSCLDEHYFKMQTLKPPSPSLISLIFFLLLSAPLFLKVSGFGSPGPIAAAFGENGFFCAVNAAGKQEAICWDKNNQSSDSASETSLPPMASLSGGDGFLCGITANTSEAYCWNMLNAGLDLVPPAFKYNTYMQIAAGKDHVCAIRGSYFSTTDDFGYVDCWEYGGQNFKNVTLAGNNSSLYYDPYVSKFTLERVVSGDGFSCGVVKENGIVCWGPKSGNLGVSTISGEYETLASNDGSVCGISSLSGEVECWGYASQFGSPPVGIQFLSLSAGASHFCGIRADDHGVECWGNIDAHSVPQGSGFLAIASSDVITCGVREVDLVLDCWGVHEEPLKDYNPPLQLCSPGVCSLGSCGSGKFAFNVSILNEPDLTSLCVQSGLKICLPCGTNCSKGYFPSSMCSPDADRVCTTCSLCQNSSCWGICGVHSSSGSQAQVKQEIKKLVEIIGSSICGVLFVLIIYCAALQICSAKDRNKPMRQHGCCLAKPVVEVDPDSKPPPPPPIAMCIGEAQVFRLSDLKDATHGFKEFNELGRGSFGFVYKAVLPDGRQVAVKRANAATIIRTNDRDFEAELETICNLRHSNIVNLLGYCAEMGERVLVYEYMPRGTLHDHLHGDLSPLSWDMRLKVALQVARGLDYLHNEVTPPVAHCNVNTSNILLDIDWVARIADFGIISGNGKNANDDKMEDDVSSFGVVLLEILSGRKEYDRECVPPGILEWALPLIREGKAAAILDRSVPLPRNVEPLLKLANLVALCLRENTKERPSMAALASTLDQIVKIGLIM